MRCEMKQNNFKFKTISLFSLMFVFSIALALSSYAVPFECNSSSPTTIGASPINITYGGDMAATQSNITMGIYVYASATANSSSSTFIRNVSNTSNLLHTNLTISTKDVLEDSSAYTIAPIAFNGSNDNNANRVTCATQTIIILDRTAPTTPTSLQPGTLTQTNGTLDIVSTVNGANTTSCTLNFDGASPGQKAYSMTHSGDSCYLKISNVAEAIYTYNIQASDGTNSSTSSSVITTINPKGSSVKAKKLGAILGGGATTEKVGKGLAIAKNTRAGEVSKGLLNAQTRITENINKFAEREKQPKELIKTGVGVGTGALIGGAIGTVVLPGIGTVAGIPLGAFIGGLVGVGV